jgi:Zn-finger nucleic acid-binding protein
MSEHKFTCPECNATLKLAQPVAGDKKIKCPKCGGMVAPVEEEGELRLVQEDEPKEAAPQATRKPTLDDDDDGPQTYEFNEAEKAAAKKEEQEQKKKKNVFEQPLRDRFPKSKRGPAQAAVIAPSNGLLAAGLITCIGSLIGVCVFAFPLIFQDRSTPPTTMVRTPTGTAIEKVRRPLTAGRDATLTPEQKADKWLWIGIYIYFFLIGCGVTTGAAKMQNIESYKLAVAGSILGMLPLTFFWLLTFPTGLWCLMVLRKPSVKAGFSGKKKRARE